MAHIFALIIVVVFDSSVLGEGEHVGESQEGLGVSLGMVSGLEINVQ